MFLDLSLSTLALPCETRRRLRGDVNGFSLRDQRETTPHYRTPETRAHCTSSSASQMQSPFHNLDHATHHLRFVDTKARVRFFACHVRECTRATKQDLS